MMQRYMVRNAAGERAYLVDLAYLQPYTPPVGYTLAPATEEDEAWAQTQPGYAPLMQGGQ